MISGGRRSPHAVLDDLLAEAKVRSASDVLVSPEQAVALYRRWNTALAARLDEALEFVGARSAAEAAEDAWHRLTSDQPELRALLDRHAAQTELRPLIEHECYLLALGAGLIGLDAPRHLGVRRGQVYLERVRRHDPVVGRGESA
jgi:hypothetical protein